MLEQPSQDQSCFVCGTENPRGMHLKFEFDDENKICFTRFTLHQDFNGWPGIAHGGIVASIMDETAYYAFINMAVITMRNGRQGLPPT